ncbi:MAG: bifunctional DNA primase/polymerase, partial [Desulfobacterales bacterium]|nr:bifunctional DNA primase/polymerase [Desulfobacterales bacterium]
MKNAEMENPAGGPGNPQGKILHTSLQYKIDNEKSLETYRKLSERRGFSLIPLKGKVPDAGMEWQKWCEKKRLFNSDEFHGRNAGVCCGPASGVIVLDEDDVKAFEVLAITNGWELPETFTVSTGNGVHLYYLYPNDGQEYGCKSLKHPVFPKHTIFDI